MSLLEATNSDELLVADLCAGNERAFRGLVAEHHATMLVVAAAYVASIDAAEQVVRETWLAVIDGLPAFDVRSGSLETWMYTVLVAAARKRGGHQQPVVGRSGGAVVHPSRFFPAGHDLAGHWSTPPRPCDPLVGDIDDHETRGVIAAAIDALAPSQKCVVWLRDVRRWTATAVCAVLDLDEASQRTLLQQGRASARAALERHLERASATSR